MIRRVNPNRRDNPIRRGGVYCSPNCGFNCAHAAYARANKEAVKLCKALGKGWEPSVWENCGWHFAASKGVASVHPRIDGSALDGVYKVTGYSIYFNSEKQIVRSCTAKEGPAALVKTATRDARLFARTMIADAEALSASV